MQLIQGMPNWEKARQSNSLKLFFVFAYGKKVPKTFKVSSRIAIFGWESHEWFLGMKVPCLAVCKMQKCEDLYLLWIGKYFFLNQKNGRKFLFFVLNVIL